MPTKQQRAAPLPPAERRQAIVTAVIPLLLEKGAAVTSRQMAETAGIAEGTIFRVFPDKAAVIKAAMKSSMDPAPVCEAMAGIPESASIEEQLEAVATILVERTERVAALHVILRTMPSGTSRRSADIPRFVRESNDAILEALTQLLERHAPRLRVSPLRAAIALRGLIFANAYPIVSPSEKTARREIVDLLLNGIVARERPV